MVQQANSSFGVSDSELLDVAKAVKNFNRKDDQRIQAHFLVREIGGSSDSRLFTIVSKSFHKIMCSSNSGSSIGVQIAQYAFLIMK